MMFLIKKLDDVSMLEKMIKKLFVKMDVNGDGEIFWEEFYDGVMKDLLVLVMLQFNFDQCQFYMQIVFYMYLMNLYLFEYCIFCY